LFKGIINVEQHLELITKTKYEKYDDDLLELQELLDDALKRAAAPAAAPDVNQLLSELNTLEAINKDNNTNALLFNQRGTRNELKAEVLSNLELIS